MEHEKESGAVERDYDYIWRNAYLLPHLIDRLHEEQRNIFEHNRPGGLTEARNEARKKLQDELTDDEYQAAVDEIATRKVAQMIVRENMLDEADNRPKRPTSNEY